MYTNSPEVMEFINTLTAWHKGRVEQLELIKNNRETGIQLGELKIEADTELAKGIRLGVAIALQQLGKLPFSVEPVSGPVYLLVEAGVRYWDDARVNGVPDENGAAIPFRDGDMWKPVIRLADGQVMNWPEGITADIHYKVCDAGEYFLADESMQKVAKWGDHYVPNDLLCVGDNGYGDYIILKVNGSGQIEGWKKPVIDENEWVDA